MLQGPPASPMPWMASIWPRVMVVMVVIVVRGVPDVPSLTRTDAGKLVKLLDRCGWEGSTGCMLLSAGGGALVGMQATLEAPAVRAATTAAAAAVVAARRRCNHERTTHLRVCISKPAPQCKQC